MNKLFMNLLNGSRVAALNDKKKKIYAKFVNELQ